MGEDKQEIRLQVIKPGQKLNAPEIACSESTNDSATICWSSVQGAYSYNVFYSTTESRPTVPYQTISANSERSVTVSGLKPKTQYYFWVSAVDVNGEESLSVPLCILTAGEQKKEIVIYDLAGRRVNVKYFGDVIIGYPIQFRAVVTIGGEETNIPVQWKASAGSDRISTENGTIIVHKAGKYDVQIEAQDDSGLSTLITVEVPLSFSITDAFTGAELAHKYLVGGEMLEFSGFDPIGQTRSITVKSNAEWTVEVPAYSPIEWSTTSGGQGETEVTLKLLEKTHGLSRYNFSFSGFTEKRTMDTWINSASAQIFVQYGDHFAKDVTGVSVLIAPPDLYAGDRVKIIVKCQNSASVNVSRSDTSMSQVPWLVKTSSTGKEFTFTVNKKPQSGWRDVFDIVIDGEQVLPPKNHCNSITITGSLSI